MILAPGIRRWAATLGSSGHLENRPRLHFAHGQRPGQPRDRAHHHHLAHDLGLTVVAEGTEKQEHVDLLKQLNCEIAQGYFYSRPAPDQAILSC